MRILFLLLILSAPLAAQTGQSKVWLTVDEEHIVSTLAGEVLTVDVHLDTRGEQLNGLQLFFSFSHPNLDMLPWAVTDQDTSWFSTNLPSNSVAIFSGPNRDRSLGTSMPGERYDWGINTAFPQAGLRPLFTFNGIICQFRIRARGELHDHELNFDHHNAFFRNSLYWRNQSAEEFSFAHEGSLIISAEATAIAPEQNTSPGEFELLPATPNPFNPSTTIRFTLKHESTVQLAAHSILGAEVAQLLNERLPAGEHSLNWNATDLPSGIYFLRLSTENYSKAIKVQLIK